MSTLSLTHSNTVSLFGFSHSDQYSGCTIRYIRYVPRTPICGLITFVPVHSVSPARTVSGRASQASFSLSLGLHSIWGPSQSSPDPEQTNQTITEEQFRPPADSDVRDIWRCWECKKLCYLCRIDSG